MNSTRKSITRGYEVEYDVRAPLVASGLVLASSIIFLLNTRYGIGILPDSVAYMQIGVAEHFAPLYTWLLQGGEAFGFNIVTVAKWLGLVLVALNTLLIWQLLLTSTSSVGHAAMGTALIVFSPVWVEMHAVAMSEPLFLALLLCAVLLFVRALGDRRRYWFVFTGGIIGIAMLARFAAAPILAAICVCRLLDSDRSIGTRLFDCVLMGTASVLIFGLWMIASELTAGHSTGRPLAFYGHPDAELWLSGLHSLSIMLLPSPVPAVVRVPFLIVALGAMLWVSIAYGRRWLRRTGTEAARRWATLPVVCGLFTLSYLAFIVLSVHMQASLPLNGRILLPAYVAAVLMTTVILGRGDSVMPVSKEARTVLVALAAVILLSHGVRTAKATAEAFANGIGYANRAWASSPILRAVDSLPDGARIYTNAPDVISFRLGRHAEYVPKRVSHLTLLENPDAPFLEQMDAMRRDLELNDAYVVFVDRVDWRFYLVTENNLVEALPLVKVSETEDGRIYQHAAHR